MAVSHVLDYGQLLVLNESLTDLLVLVDIIEIALCVIALSETNDDDDDVVR